MEGDKPQTANSVCYGRKDPGGARGLPGEGKCSGGKGLGDPGARCPTVAATLLCAPLRGAFSSVRGATPARDWGFLQQEIWAGPFQRQQLWSHREPQPRVEMGHLALESSQVCKGHAPAVGAVQAPCHLPVGPAWPVLSWEGI